MKAYINDKGHIIAVFKDHFDSYGIYMRKEEKGYFKRTAQRIPTRKTRSDAETDMDDIIYNSSDTSWKKIDFRG